MPIHTIGHSSHPLDAFVELLRRHRIAALVDVRSRPYSRWAPHFEKAPLSRALSSEGIDYIFLGRELGGRPEGAEFYTPDGRVDYERRARAFDFQAGIEQLVALAAERATAILCAEEDPSRCHRRLLVTPALERSGLEVVHIRGDGSLQSEAELREPTSQLSLFD
jgi:uncharacterized protein (DUF488 family)